MAKKKQVQLQTATSTWVLRLFCIITYLLGAYIIYSDYSEMLIQILGILILSIVAVTGFVVWWTKNKDTFDAWSNRKLMISYLITVSTMTFYSIALVRADQWIPFMKTSVLVGGLIVYNAVSKTLPKHI